MSDFFSNYGKNESQTGSINETSNFGLVNDSHQSGNLFNFGDDDAEFPGFLGFGASLFPQDQSQVVPPIKTTQANQQETEQKEQSESQFSMMDSVLPARTPFQTPYARDAVKQERVDSKSASKGKLSSTNKGKRLEYSSTHQDETKSEGAQAAHTPPTLQDDSIYSNVLNEFAAPEVKPKPNKRTSGAKKESYTPELKPSSGYYGSMEMEGGDIGSAEMSALKMRKMQVQKHRKQRRQEMLQEEEEDERINNFELSRISERIGEEESSRFIESKELFDEQVLQFIQTPLSSQEHELKKLEIKEAAERAFEELKRRKDEYLKYIHDDMMADLQVLLNDLDDSRAQAKKKQKLARIILQREIEVQRTVNDCADKLEELMKQPLEHEQ